MCGGKVAKLDKAYSKYLEVFSLTFDVTYVVLHWQKIIIHKRIAFQFLLGSSHIRTKQAWNRLEINPTIRPGAAPTAPDMRVRLSQIEPDFLTRSVIFLNCLKPS
ncbi:unnamed protein product [Brassica napus]|uniref:(rape) hypothetical protein n=1 Tax=Brassica napus TaxID=3708 RepID=A0A816KB65_BRANA|nr:unnamed protein product [Brassica napus]